jgi:patatin-like phospholipase/acyl hydrolase
MKKILSIDGGGIRGIIPAIILSHVEKLTGKSIWKIFDLVAGTSSGGILAMGLTMRDNYSAAEMVEFFSGNKAVDIFHKSFLRSVFSLGGLLCSKYPSRESVLKEVFQDAKLQDSRTPIILPSYDIKQRKPYFFKSHMLCSDNRNHFSQNPFLWDVAKCVSAAPTYFDPVKRMNSSFLVDGGVCANNPTLCAYAEAKIMFPDEQIAVLSLGTGKPLSGELIKSGGYLGWLPKIFKVFSEAPEATVQYQMKALYSGNRNNYLRLQESLLMANQEALDNVYRITIAFQKAALDCRKVCRKLGLLTRRWRE